MEQEELDIISHLEGLNNANAAALACKRILNGNPQGTPETDYETFHSGLADDAARQESEFQVCGGIIDGTVIPESEHDSYVTEFDTVVQVPFTNSETLSSICRRKKVL